MRVPIAVMPPSWPASIAPPATPAAVAPAMGHGVSLFVRVCPANRVVVFRIADPSQSRHERLEFRSNEGVVGDVDDLDVAVTIDDEKARLCKQVIGFFFRARHRDVDAEFNKAYAACLEGRGYSVK